MNGFSNLRNERRSGTSVPRKKRPYPFIFDLSFFLSSVFGVSLGPWVQGPSDSEEGAVLPGFHGPSLVEFNSR